MVRRFAVHRGRRLQRGSGLHRGMRLQRGAGLGSIFASILRKVAPFALRSVKRVAGSKLARGMAKSAKKSAVSMAKNAALNAIKGRDIKAGAKADLAKARARMGRSIEASLDRQQNGTGGRRRANYKTSAKASNALKKGKQKAVPREPLM